MSSIVIISAVYFPEPVVSARMGQDLARHLVKQDHCVTVICPQPSRPANVDYQRFSKPGSNVISFEEGVEVVRLPSFVAPDSILIPRLKESLSFGRHVCRYLESNGQKPDVLYVNAWPLLAQALIVRYANKNNIPVVLQIMDIYPESLTNKLPALAGKIASKPLLMLDTWVARMASAIVVISENMHRTYSVSRGIPEDRMVTVPTWQDERLFDVHISREDVFRRYGIPEGPFTFLYLGNIGPVAGVDFLIRAFRCACIGFAQLLIVGDGSAKASCVNLVEKLGGSNIYFISDPDADNVPMLQSMAHVCMLPLKHGAGLSSIPSKLPAYMFSAKPVIATVDQNSDTAEVIRRAQCGWVGEPEDLTWLAEKMKEVAGLPPEELECLGQRGKTFGLQNFSRSQGIRQLSDVILATIFNKEKVN